MSDIAIRVENLGKSYRIGHQTNGQRGRYRTLRDDLLALPAGLWRNVGCLRTGHDQ